MNAPSWWPSRRAAWRGGLALLAVVVGTGGCGAGLQGVAHIMSASNARVAERLSVIEGKLDAWRDAQAETRAQGAVNARALDDHRSQLRGLDARVTHMERACAER